MEILTAILLTLFLFYIFVGTGLFLFKCVKYSSDSFGTIIFLAFAAGTGIVGELIFLLASVQKLSPQYILTMLLITLITATAGWSTISFKDLLTILAPPENRIEWFTAIGTLFILAAGLTLSQTPEISKDALIYHLAVPKLYLKNNGFSFISGNIYSNLPLQSEMLYTIALFLKGDILAKGVNFLAFLTVLLWVKEFSSRILNSSFPYLSMFIFAMLPTAFSLSHVSYADLYCCLYVLAALHLFIQWQKKNSYTVIMLSAYFTGLAISTKYSALILPLLALLGILINFRESRDMRKLLYTLLLFVLVTFASGSLFYIKNFILTGNPLYPFFYEFFGGRGLDRELASL
ncbi:hypothetical protein HXX01_05155, partial [Candidatus Nomurabacteria bacterium]|nr:hypothetical protein [Candidatus Nomurabacteria bacterium]